MTASNKKLGHLSQRFVVGAAWMLVTKVLERCIGFISTLVLARLLVPEDFGLVALAAPVIGLVELLGAIGIEFAVIQKRESGDDYFNTAWTIQLCLASLVAIIVFVASPYAAMFFREARLENVLQWLAAGVFIQGFENIGLLRFRKDVIMSRDVAMVLTKKIASFAIATVFALYGARYWALVAGTLSSRLIGVAMSYILSSYRPRLCLTRTRELMSFSIWVFFNNIMNYMTLRAPDAVIGRLIGAEGVAIYMISYEMASVFTGEVSAAVARVTLPAFSEIGADLQRLKEGCLKVLAGVATFSLPAGFGVAATASLLIPTLLGDKWSAAIEIVGPLGIVWSVLALFNQLSFVYYAVGKPKWCTFINGSYILVLVILLIISVRAHGVSGVVSAYSVGAVWALVINYIALRALFGRVLLREWLGAIYRPLLAAGLMYFSVTALKTYLPPTGVVSLLLAVICGVVVYSAVLLALWFIAKKPAGIEAMVMKRLVGEGRA